VGQTPGDGASLIARYHRAASKAELCPPRGVRHETGGQSVDEVLEAFGAADDDALRVVAAAIVRDGRLLVVSKKAAERVFYLPGGKPEEGEDPGAALARELDEELGIRTVTHRLLAVVTDVAALEQVPMRMAVFITTVAGTPSPAAELAAMGWTTGRDEYRPLLAPAVRNQVVPLLTTAGLLAG
jgi:ADP-ribose pyrophosphatase YjhB (NUDIX family)